VAVGTLAWVHSLRPGPPGRASLAWVRSLLEAAIATTFLGTLSLKKTPPEMLKVTISELFKRFHGHAAAIKSEVIDFQSTFDLGALFTLKD